MNHTLHFCLQSISITQLRVRMTDHLTFVLMSPQEQQLDDHHTLVGISTNNSGEGDGVSIRPQDLSGPGHTGSDSVWKWC